MVGTDDADAVEAALWNQEAGQAFSSPSPRAPRPHWQSCFERVAGEELKGGRCHVMLEVEPLRVLPLVGLRGGDIHILVSPMPVEVDASEALRGHRPVLHHDQGDGEEVFPELEV